jgi:hypothetical protein
VPAAFFEPMSAEELDLWESANAADPSAISAPALRRGSRVAEGKTQYRPRRRRDSRRTS